MEPEETQSTADLSLSDEYRQAQEKFDSIFDQRAEEMRAEESGEGKAKPPAKAEGSEAAPAPKPKATAATVADRASETPETEEEPQDSPEPAPAPRQARQAPSADDQREGVRRNILSGMDHLNRMKRVFERQYGTSLYPPELLERERLLNEAEMDLDKELPRVSTAMDARINRVVNERVREAIENYNQNVSRMSGEQAANQQIAIVRIAHPDVDLRDPKFHREFITWAQTLPYAEATELLDIHRGGDASEVIGAINKFKEAKGLSQTPADNGQGVRPAGSSDGLKKGRTAAALAVPTRRTASPKPSGSAGKDPNDFDGAFEEARAKYA